MITNKGKSIIGKYLLGQAPAYASYIAVGCGAKPLASYPTGGDLTTLKNTIAAKNSLDFEMFRIPITSKGFVNEDGVSKLVLTAELPTEERYEISEVGIFSAGSNPAAAAIDSRILLGFTQNEPWQSHAFINKNDPGTGLTNIVSVPFITDAIDTTNLLTPKITATVTNVTTNGTTLTVSANNAFIAGESVTITGVTPNSFNITGTIESSTSTQFTIASTVGNATITNATANGTTMTITANNNFQAGNSVTITGVNPSVFNITGIISTATSTQFTIQTSAASGQTYVSGGLARLNFQSAGTATASASIFQVNSDNSTFSFSGRANVYERGRYYNNMLVMRGDVSGIFKNPSTNTLDIAATSNHIHLNNVKINLTQNSPLDELRLAFSVLCKDVATIPETINVMIEFKDTDETSGEYARLEGTLTQNNAILDPNHNPANGVNFGQVRYFVLNKKLQNLVASNGFTWNSVNVVKIYVSATEKRKITYMSKTGNTVTLRSNQAFGVEVGDTVYTSYNGQSSISGAYQVTSVTTSPNFQITYDVPTSGTIAVETPNDITLYYVEKLRDDAYVALDGLRVENVTTQNPLYGLTGYSLIVNPTESTIVKNPNSNNYIEFRFVLDVM